MSEIIRRSLSLLDTWKPFSKGRKVSNMYGLSLFGKDLVSRTGVGYRRETFDAIDPMMVSLIDFFNSDEANKYFFAEVGSQLSTTPEETVKLLRNGGAFAKVIDVHSKQYRAKNVVECQNLWVEWKNFPRVLQKRRMPCPLLEKAVIQELSLPPYLWRKYEAAKVLFLVLSFPVRYDYKIRSVQKGKEIIVDYCHPVWGRLKSEVFRPVMQGISRGEITQHDVIDNVRLTLEGKETDLAHVYHTGLDYRDMIEKAPSIKERLKIRKFSSMKDYLLQTYGISPSF